MSDIFELDSKQPGAVNAPASLPVGAYKLDWQETEIDFGKGRSHTLRRPTVEEVLDREKELQTEIPVGRDGSYQLPDPTANEANDAKLFDKIVIASAGYPGDVPEQHKATAIAGLYQREIYVDEDHDLNQEEIPVLEEIGSGDEPDFTVLHLMRMPAEGELKLYRRKSTGGEIKPGKRGRQIFKTSSNLKTAMSFYQQWLLRVDGATVDGQTYSDENRPAFLAHVDPLIQRQVVNAVVEAVTAKLSD